MTPYIRIALRYLASFLVAAGYMLPADAAFIVNDPDVLMLIGAALGSLTELWYIVADRFGWRK